MPSISKNDCCADRFILAPLNAYQDYLETFKSMTSQVGNVAIIASLDCLLDSRFMENSFFERGLVGLFVFYFCAQTSA